MSLKLELKKRKIKQVQFARAMGKTKQYVSQLCGEQYYVKNNILYGKSFLKTGRLADNVVIKDLSSIFERV